VAQLAVALKHVVVMPGPLASTEVGSAVEGVLDTPVGPEDAEVFGDELPEVPLDPGAEPLVGWGDTDDDGTLPAEVVRAPVEQGVVGLAVTQAQRELAAPRTAPIEAPQLLITQF